jgi:hypothetical protein
VRGEAVAALHARYAAALEAFAKQGEKRAPRALSIMTRLLGYLEQHGGGLRARVKRTRNLSIEREDAKQAAAGGLYAPAASSFDSFNATLIERRMVEELTRAFGEMMPDDVLPIATSDDPAATAPPPTLTIAYETFAPGGTYESETSGRRFLEVRFKFDVTIAVPGEEEVFHWSTTSKPPADGFQLDSDVPVLDKQTATYRKMTELAVGGLALALEDALLGAASDPKP